MVSASILALAEVAEKRTVRAFESRWRVISWVWRARRFRVRAL